MKRYRLYGLDLASELSLTHAVPEISADEAAGPPDLTLELAAAGTALPGEDDPGAEIVYRSPERRPEGEPILEAIRNRSGTILRYSGEAAFALEERDERRIVARPEAPGDEGRALVELRLLGPVLAFWLERSGVLTLHASAVTIGRGAVAFPATQRGGKSSLAAAMARGGHSLLADDVLAVVENGGAGGGFLARPSYPQMRFEPGDAAHWLGADRAAPLPRSHPGFEKVRVPVGTGGLGRFDSEPRPLVRIYLPERRITDREGSGAPVAIEAVSGREAIMALVAGSFLPRLAQAVGWSARRLDLIGRLASSVPVRRIVYPDGLEHLPRVAACIAADTTFPA